MQKTVCFHFPVIRLYNALNKHKKMTSILTSFIYKIHKLTISDVLCLKRLIC